MNFNIETLERNTDDGVVVVHWQANKAQGENVAYSYGSINFTPDPSSEGYVPYDDLTQATVIGWVQAAIDTDALEALLDADLAEQASPSIITGTPW